MKLGQDGLPKYIVNWEELTEPLKYELLKLIDDAFKDQYPQINTHDIEAALEAIRDLLPANHYQDLQHKIDQFVYHKVIGIQKAEGSYLDIPPIIKKTQYDFMYDKDVFLTGFHIDQTGWKKEDRYNLIVNKQYLIKNAATKEIGEHKHFNTFFKVNANTPISFVLENNSGNSRETAIDLEYIEGSEITLDPPPPPPDSPAPTDEYWMGQIPNPWDLAVIMNWETCDIDVDLHGFIDSTHVYYPQSKRDQNGLHLNFDYTSHTSNTFPEILSVEGNHGKTLKVYIHNFDGEPLSQPVNIKIYNKDVNGYPNLLKEYNYTLTTDRNHLYGICSINIDTLIITDIHDTKIVI